MSLAAASIERSKRNCKSWSVLLTDQCATGRRIALWRVPCNSWSCPTCAKKKANAISHKARLNFEGKRLRLLTLTIRPMASLPSAISLINAAWNRLRLKLNRKYGKIKYLKVMEVQPGTGMPHFHVLVDKYLDSTWLNVAVPSSGFGQIYDIRQVRSELVFQYVLKYLRKGIRDIAFLDALLSCRGRRYGFSQGMHKIETYMSMRPIHLYKHGDTSPDLALWTLRFFEISKSVGYYPISVSDDYACYFNPAPVALLPAPPTSGSSPPATMPPK